MKEKEYIDVRGQCRATMIGTDEQGRRIPVGEALSGASKGYLQDRGVEVKDVMHDGNLVVNTGRETLARLIGGDISDFINRIVLGDLGNGVSKQDAKPQLTDNELYHVLRTLNDAPQGTFLLKPDDHFYYPSRTGRYPSDLDVDWAPTKATVSKVNGEYVLEDPHLTGSTHFNSLGVQMTDQVTLDTNTVHPLVVGVKSVKSDTEIVLHNPRGYETPGGDEIRYSIATPGTQLLVSRIIKGNNFDVDTWGPATLVKEAGLLTNNDRLFNRVIFAPHSDDYGMLLQSDEINNKELSIRFEWLLTF